MKFIVLSINQRQEAEKYNYNTALALVVHVSSLMYFEVLYTVKYFNIKLRMAYFKIDVVRANQY